MTEVQISELRTDLSDKFNKLCSIRCQHALFVSEYFFDLRNSIDYDAERALSNLKIDPAQFDAINRTRTEWIDLLDHIEKTLISQLSAESRPNLDEDFPSIKHNIDQFQSPPGQDVDLDAKKAEYAQIVLEIINEATELEKKLLGKQTIFYLSSSSESALGTLFYVPKVHLSSYDLSFLR